MITQNPDEPQIRITPKGVIFLALGGFQNAPASTEATEKVVEELLKFMDVHRQDLVVWVKDGQKCIRFLGKNE